MQLHMSSPHSIIVSTASEYHLLVSIITSHFQHPYTLRYVPYPFYYAKVSTLLCSTQTVYVSKEFLGTSLNTADIFLRFAMTTGVTLILQVCEMATYTYECMRLLLALTNPSPLFLL